MHDVVKPVVTSFPSYSRYRVVLI